MNHDLDGDVMSMDDDDLCFEVGEDGIQGPASHRGNWAGPQSRYAALVKTNPKGSVATLPPMAAVQLVRAARSGDRGAQGKVKTTLALAYSRHPDSVVARLAERNLHKAAALEKAGIRVEKLLPDSVVSGMLDAEIMAMEDAGVEVGGLPLFPLIGGALGAVAAFLLFRPKTASAAAIPANQAATPPISSGAAQKAADAFGTPQTAAPAIIPGAPAAAQPSGALPGPVVIPATGLSDPESATPRAVAVEQTDPLPSGTPPVPNGNTPIAQAFRGNTQFVGTLLAGQSLRSPSGSFVLCMQTDGNLVWYNGTPGNPANAMWSSGTSGKNGRMAIMQTDGNLVIYNGSGTGPVWSTETYGHPGAYLALQKDGNLVIYGSPNYAAPLWASRSGKLGGSSGPFGFISDVLDAVGPAIQAGQSAAAIFGA